MESGECVLNVSGNIKPDIIRDYYLKQYRDDSLARVDKAKWNIKHCFGIKMMGEHKLLKLKLDKPIFFDALIRKWEQPMAKEKDILKEVAAEYGVDNPPKKIPVPFSREFYDAMRTAGYTKFDPTRIAKIYNRLEEIATCDYVEPRDSIAASKVILQYNDMDTTQMQKQNKDMKDEIAMTEVKGLVDTLKKQFSKVKEIEVQDENRVS